MIGIKEVQLTQQIHDNRNREYEPCSFLIPDQKNKIRKQYIEDKDHSEEPADPNHINRGVWQQSESQCQIREPFKCRIQRMGQYRFDRAQKREERPNTSEPAHIKSFRRNASLFDPFIVSATHGKSGYYHKQQGQFAKFRYDPII